MTAFTLKRIALITMIIDHIDKILQIRSSSLYQYSSVAGQIYNIIVLTGRVAFPIYAFLIAEGCRKTRSMPKYIFRLFLFMIISEIFYIAAFYNNNTHGLELLKYAFDHVLTLKFRNIFTTLMFGVIAIYAYQIISSLNINKILRTATTATIVLLIMYTAEYFRASYGFLGIALIFLLYLFNSRKMQAMVIVLWSVGFYLIWASYNGVRFLFLENFIYWQWAVFACFAAVAVILYNGNRGKSMKWLFYIAYPLHLILLIIAREVIVLLQNPL